MGLCINDGPLEPVVEKQVAERAYSYAVHLAQK